MVNPCFFRLLRRLVTVVLHWIYQAAVGRVGLPWRKWIVRNFCARSSNCWGCKRWWFAEAVWLVIVFNIRRMSICFFFLGQYILPLLSERPDSFYISCIIALALSNTNQLPATTAKDIVTPVLALRGSYDTSLGQNAANNLKHLANSRVLTVPDSKHLCHLNNSKYFHTVSLNFLDIVLNHITKSPFVSDV